MSSGICRSWPPIHECKDQDERHSLECGDCETRNGWHPVKKTRAVNQGKHSLCAAAYISDCLAVFPSIVHVAKRRSAIRDNPYWLGQVVVEKVRFEQLSGSNACYWSQPSRSLRRKMHAAGKKIAQPFRHVGATLPAIAARIMTQQSHRCRVG